MILGISTATFTLVHVIISLIAIVSGLVTVLAMARGHKLPGWTTVFLVTTIATSASGFLFHSKSFGPPHVVGVISLVVLALACAALYVYRLGGLWRSVYILAAVFALYLNAFVAVIQAFQKIGFLHSLAPTQQEAPFVIAQLLVLAAFVVLSIVALRRFHPARAPV